MSSLRNIFDHATSAPFCQSFPRDVEDFDLFIRRKILNRFQYVIEC